jgi:hypothetical protein
LNFTPLFRNELFKEREINGYGFLHCFSSK